MFVSRLILGPECFIFDDDSNNCSSGLSRAFNALPQACQRFPTLVDHIPKLLSLQPDVERVQEATEIVTTGGTNLIHQMSAADDTGGPILFSPVIIVTMVSVTCVALVAMGICINKIIVDRKKSTQAGTSEEVGQEMLALSQVISNCPSDALLLGPMTAPSARYSADRALSLPITRSQ